MSRDSGSEQPTQRTVAELLAEYGSNSSQRSERRRRRRAEDPTETAPQAIIDRVLSDSGRMRPIQPDEAPPQPTNHRQAPAPPTGAAPPPPPAQPAPAAPPPAPAPQAPPPAQPPPAEPQDAAPERPAGGNFWARRFAGANPAPPAQQEQAGPPAPQVDPDATAQQPMVPPPPQPRPQAAPPEPPAPAPPEAAPAGPPRPVAHPQNEGVTEQFPRVDADENYEDAVAPSGTALMGYPDTDDGYIDDAEYGDPYGYDYDDTYGEDGFVEDDYGDDVPTGMDADDFFAEDAEADEDEQAKSPGKEWLVLVVQVGFGLLGGGAIWFGFRWLWNVIPLGALAAALVVTGVLVLIARKFLRTDDLQTILLAVLVGLTCTVSPAALLLVGY